MGADMDTITSAQQTSLYRPSVRNLIRVYQLRDTDIMMPTNSNLTNNTPQSEETPQLSQQQVASSIQADVQQDPQQPLQNPPGLNNGQGQRLINLPLIPPSILHPPLVPPPPHPQSLIPEVLISRDTIEYVGFTSKMADHMWDAWGKWPSGKLRRETDPDDGRPCITFLQFMIRHIVYYKDAAFWELDEWEKCMDIYGLSESTQKEIMKCTTRPHFPFFNCSHWAKMVVLSNYEVLQRLQRTCSLQMMRPDPARHRALPLRFRKKGSGSETTGSLAQS
ncbi:uncharacterized protein NECHADRAFT_78126 [Fusarium vanettenii 77-13-4]|uniref:Uncharacterized protein n=1 Tax=Fusarium vanettenii (strain ATCC MYA-4622 / CBS 123669 / FGSC 9596 / NRRL 45880 / 77-13-4) TaxID=660122 RepID=C7YN70_FUSV7|nr:uncharacterized protein NECHADRAFT_78126 [Fusarium vanettenii 77-13-4]EEU47572.1 predicted protein [Fusarium vanettenii 77-13-4]